MVDTRERAEVERLRARVAELEARLSTGVAGEFTWRELADGSPNMIFVNAGGRLVYANRRCAEVMGYSHEELAAPGFDFRVLVAPESRDLVQRNFVRHQRGDEVEPYDYTVLTRNGQRLEVSIATRLIDHHGERAILGVITDVTVRNRALRDLRDSEARYRTLVETCPDSIVVTDLAGRHCMANQRAAEVLGFGSVEAFLAQGLVAVDTIAPEHHELVRRQTQRVLATRQPVRAEYEALRRDGSRVLVEVVASVLCDQAGEPQGFIGVTRDLTERVRAEEERRRLEAEVQHSKRLESLGVLAGGVAHDFGNILVGVLGNASLALAQLPSESPARDRLEKVILAAERAARLTKQMLAYSGGGAFTKEALDLKELVLQVARLLEFSIPRRLCLELDVAPDVPAVLGDPGQIEQVVMNLLTNAAEAMERQGDIIRVGVHAVDAATVERKDLLSGELPRAQRYVCLTVTDAGCGMDTATRERIFDPFFSTKFRGRGLGLAAVLGIVRGHGGGMRVESEPGAGTRFRVYLPAASEVAGPRPFDRAVRQTAVRGPATVLFADDDELVREVAQYALSRAGYEVLLACDGEEAVRTVCARGGAISLVVLDLTMPGVAGEQAYRAIKAVQPELPVILSSGYSESEVTGRVPPLGFTRFIHKPYLPEELVGCVGDALAHQPRAVDTRRPGP